MTGIEWILQYEKQKLTKKYKRNISRSAIQHWNRPASIRNSARFLRRQAHKLAFRVFSKPKLRSK